MFTCRLRMEGMQYTCHKLHVLRNASQYKRLQYIGCLLWCGDNKRTGTLSHKLRNNCDKVPDYWFDKTTVSVGVQCVHAIVHEKDHVRTCSVGIHMARIIY